jgi:hypothetical protein
MNKMLKLTATLTLVTIMVSPSAFAETRHRSETNGSLYRVRTVTVEGRIRDIDRERNGLLIRLERGGAALFASPQTDIYVGSRRTGNGRFRQLDRGDVIRATGSVGARGTIYLDSITLLRNDGPSNRTVRGLVQSINVSQRLVAIREDQSGRIFTIDLRNAQRNDRRWDNERDERWSDIRNIRRGDRIIARGDWRGNVFEAERYDVGENAQW